MADGMGEHLEVFDLDALRKAFLEFIEEHKTRDHPEWGELAKLFLEKTTRAAPRTGPYPAGEG
ncbi:MULTISPECIES: hypothetical protein [unclassified Mesorhizobium]|uniref:hypothetical protein n=1 Tax=unclassified Mesorhizobium TaxID=325217 RepID=UPI00040FDAC2|nr:hypothetical protein [Mesorhizobium sp. L103C105A0]